MPDVLCLYPGTVTFRQEQVRAHRHVLEALGIRLLLADDYVVDSDAEHFASCIALPVPQNVGEGLRVLESALRGRRIDGVLAQSESGLCLGSLFARARGLPCIRPEAALLTTSKHLCRVALEKAGVTQPRFALVTSAAEVREFARKNGFPVVLKGVASALGRLVTLVRDDASIDASVAFVRAGLPGSVDVRRLVDFARVAELDLGCDPLRQFLVESFARGSPVETDGVVAGDAILTFGVTEQVLAAPPLFYMEGYLLPADRPPAELAEIERTSDAALRAVGVENSGFSIEMRVDAGRATIIEVNGRLGWDEGFGDLFAAITGSQPAFQSLEVALGGRPRFERKRDAHAAVAYACCYEDRSVKRVPSPADVARIEREHGVRAGIAVYPGVRTFAPPSPDCTPHTAWALATDASSSRAAYERARRAVDAFEFEFETVDDSARAS